MPRLFEIDGYVFFFFSNEGTPLKRCHVHVRRGGDLCKIDVEPEVKVVSNYGMSPKEMNKLVELVERHKGLIKEKYDDYFG